MSVDTKILCTDLAAVNADAVALTRGLTRDQLAWRPDPSTWSIAENLIHLCNTTNVFLPAVDHAIAESRSRKLLDVGPFRLNWYGRLLIWYVEPPPKIRLPAPKVLRPQLIGPSEQSLENFFTLQSAMMRRMEDANGLNITGLRFRSPLASYIRMNLLEFFSVFNGHSRRHLWQAANVRRTVIAKNDATVG